MGAWTSYCVRDCERPAQEYAGEDLLPGSAGSPGMSSSSLPAPASAPLRVGSKSCGDQAGGVSGSGGGSQVPPVPNWFQVLKRDAGANAGISTETPRFDEVLMSSPHSSNGGEFRTPGPSPRDSPRVVQDQEAAANAEIYYKGTYLGSMKHGFGSLRVKGSTYEGDFLNDHKHGNGALTWDDGRQYKGQFQEGKFHGAAVMTWPDGRKYHGQYIDDRKHGEGTFSWHDGRRYHGQWVCGKRHGIGVYTNAKGLTRTGMWQMDRPLHWEVPSPESTSRAQGADETDSLVNQDDVMTPERGPTKVSNL